MKKDILSSIENIEIYPIISLLIFVLFFVGMFIWVIRVDKNYVAEMKEMPLKDKTLNDLHHEKN